MWNVELWSQIIQLSVVFYLRSFIKEWQNNIFVCSNWSQTTPQTLPLRSSLRDSSRWPSRTPLPLDRWGLMPLGSWKDTTGFSDSLLAESDMLVLDWRVWWDEVERQLFGACCLIRSAEYAKCLMMDHIRKTWLKWYANCFIFIFSLTDHVHSTMQIFLATHCRSLMPAVAPR